MRSEEVLDRLRAAGLLMEPPIGDVIEFFNQEEIEEVLGEADQVRGDGTLNVMRYQCVDGKDVLIVGKKAGGVGCVVVV